MFLEKRTVDGSTGENASSKVKSSEKKPYEAHVQPEIPIKQIYRGMIITTDDRYVKIMEILPINFNLRSYEEQGNIISLFAGWLRIAPIKLQFKVITRRADTFKIINNVKLATEAEQHKKCRELASDYISFIRQVSEKEALTRRFFIVFEYEPSSTRKRTIDEIAVEMKTAEMKVRAGLNSCGNEVITPDNEDFFQAEILYTFYNRNSCADETLASRVLRVTHDEMKLAGLEEGVDDYPDIPVSDYIAPRGLDFTHPDYIVCDGMYQSIFFVEKDGYPTEVQGGWMSTLIETGEGIDIDICLAKESRAKAKDRVALKLKLNRIKASSRNDTDTDFEEIEGAIQSAKYIKDCLSNGEDLYQMQIFITVSANTKEQLQRRKEAMFDYLYSNDLTVREIHLRLEDAFQIVTPVLSTKKELMDIASRNIMTNGVASTYPFTSCELCDENGIVLGINRRYNSLVNVDIFNTKKYKNANMTILGTSGAGKTYLELMMALRMRMQGIQTFIISPDKAHEFKRACYHIDGSYVRISPGAKSCINVMEIRPIQSPISELLDEGNNEEDSWLAQKASQLLIFFHLLIPDLTNEEEQLVDEAIIKTYNLFNITHDNNSLYNAVTKELRPMPIIGDLYDVLKQNADTKRVANILGRFVTGSAKSFNQQTNVDLQNKFIVFDLQDLTGNLKAVGMFIVMDFLWTRIKENRTERKAIFIDEGWQLIGASADTHAADFVYRIFKIIRGYCGSAIFATQDISDLFAFQDGKYGKAIISNSRIKIVLQLEQQEAKCVRDALQLTKNEMRSIVNFQRGEGLICANNNKVPVFIRASAKEDELITTDPAQLRDIIQRRQTEKQVEEEKEQREKFRAALAKSCSIQKPIQDIIQVQAKNDSGVKPKTVAPITKDELDDVIAPLPDSNKANSEALKKEAEIARRARMSALAMEQLADVDKIQRQDEKDAALTTENAIVKMDSPDEFEDISSFEVDSNVPKHDAASRIAMDADEDLESAMPLNQSKKSTYEKGGIQHGSNIPDGF